MKAPAQLKKSRYCSGVNTLVLTCSFSKSLLRDIEAASVRSSCFACSVNFVIFMSQIIEQVVPLKKIKILNKNLPVDIVAAMLLG
jgi:hypothetical protein